MSVCLVVDVFQYLACALVGGTLFYCRDDILVIEVFGIKAIDMRATTVACLVGGVVIVSVSAIFPLGLCFDGIGIFLGEAVFYVVFHAFHMFYTKTSGKDSDLYLLFQFRIDGKSPLDFKVAKLLHELVDIAHFIHHQAVAILSTCECDVEKNLLGVENIFLVEQR